MTPQESPRRLLTLPQEVRDNIYEKLFLSKPQKIYLPLHLDDAEMASYTKASSPDSRGPDIVTHPKLQQPEALETYSYVLGDYGDSETDRVRIGPPSMASIKSRWLALHQVVSNKEMRNGIGLLRTCHQLHEEATDLVYERSTFLFPINAPLMITPLDHAIANLLHRVRHIELHLDLVTAYLRHYSLAAERDTLHAFLLLATCVFASGRNLESLVFNIDYRESTDFSKLIAGMLEIDVHHVVDWTIRFRNVYENPKFNPEGSSNAHLNERRDMRILTIRSQLEGMMDDVSRETYVCALDSAELKVLDIVRLDTDAFLNDERGGRSWHVGVKRILRDVQNSTSA